jgi:2-polyprenyl-3-methyl-5-hydroxy-6-metoxy-1,4-benzoquinol methylase
MQAALRTCEVCSGTEFTSLFEKDDHRWMRCQSCALERIDPPPTDETLTAIYGKHCYDAWGLHDDASTVSQLKKTTFSYVLGQLPSLPTGAKLLDCGAATGFLLEIAKERGFDPYGVELSEFGANTVAEKFGKDHSFRGEIESASFPGAGDGAFHAITMCDYIAHVRDPKRVLERARSLLAPNGVIALTTPDTGSLTHHALAKGWSHYKVEHLYYFGRQNITRLLESTGYRDVEFKPLWKALNLRYICQQFEVYPHPVLSQVARGLGKVVPSRLQAQTMRAPRRACRSSRVPRRWRATSASSATRTWRSRLPAWGSASTRGSAGRRRSEAACSSGSAVGTLFPRFHAQRGAALAIAQGRLRELRARRRGPTPGVARRHARCGLSALSARRAA